MSLILSERTPEGAMLTYMFGSVCALPSGNDERAKQSYNGTMIISMGKWTNMKKMIIIGVLAAIVLLFLILSGFSLHKTADRPSVAYPLSAEIKKRIVAETMGKDESELIEYALNLTAKSLQFAAKNDIEGGSANCVGYARLGAAICNHAFATNGSPSRAKAVVGDVKFWGISVCEVLTMLMPNERWRNFVKDHDFVEIETGNSIIYVDPSLYDFHVDCTTVVNKK